MIKLIDLISEEIAKPTNIYAAGHEPDINSDDIIQKGFKLGTGQINPETGKITNDVQYLPQFEVIRRQLVSMRKEFQPYKFSTNPDIAKFSKDINTNMTKVSQMVFALEKLIELQRK